MPDLRTRRLESALQALCKCFAGLLMAELPLRLRRRMGQPGPEALPRLDISVSLQL